MTAHRQKTITLHGTDRYTRNAKLVWDNEIAISATRVMNESTNCKSLQTSYNTQVSYARYTGINHLFM